LPGARRGDLNDDLPCKWRMFNKIFSPLPLKGERIKVRGFLRSVLSWDLKKR
jgi:hypothetical protein